MRIRLRTSLLLSAPLLVLSILLSCGKTPEGKSPERKEREKKTELVVAGAASLKDAFEDIGTNFSKEHPDIRILFNFAGSNMLARQIESGAPVDVVAVAAEEILRRLDSAGLLLDGSERIFAHNRLCILLPEESNLSLADIAALGEVPAERIAIASEGVPARLYAEEALRRAGLWDRLLPRLVYGTNVRQVMSYVEQGEADCGFVYTSDALIAKGTRIACIVDSALHQPIRYPAAIVRGSEHGDEAQIFLDYLTSAAGKEILEQYGFNR